jgi:hypothetical protein
MITVTSRARDGFRRAGRAHPAGRVVYPAGLFTAEQLEALKADPLFIVDVEDEAKAAPRDGVMEALVASLPAADVGLLADQAPAVEASKAPAKKTKDS